MLYVSKSGVVRDALALSSCSEPGGVLQLLLGGFAYAHTEPRREGKGSRCFQQAGESSLQSESFIVDPEWRLLFKTL